MRSMRVAFLVAVALVGLALAVFSWREQNQEGPQFEVVSLEGEEGRDLAGQIGIKPNPEHGPEVSLRSRARAADEIDHLAELPAAIGTTYWVRPGSSEGNPSGTRGEPWLGLADNLTKLKSGDRVVLASGRYSGPFTLPVVDGDAPIELVGQAGVVFRNADDANRPVLRIEGAWSLIGIEIQPGASSIGIEFVGEQPATLDQGHINSGGREGIVIRGSARNVRVVESHVHHVGGLREPGIRIENGARRIQLDRNKIHGLRGPEIFLFEEDRFESVARGQRGTRRAELPGEEIWIREAVWEP